MPTVKFSDDHIAAFLDSIYLAGNSIAAAAEMFGLSQGYASQVARGHQHHLRDYRDYYAMGPTYARPGRKSFLNLDVPKVRAMYLAGGWTHVELAKQFGCSRETIGKALMGVLPAKKKRPGVTNEEIRRMVRRQAEGASAYLIAKELDRAQTTIARYLRQYGLRT